MHVCTIATTDDEVIWALSPARYSSWIALDTETDGLGRGAMAIGVSLATNRLCPCGGGHFYSVYLPFGHVTDEPQARMSVVRDGLKKLIDTMPPDCWTLFNKTFDIMVMKNTFGFAPPWHEDAPDVWHMAYLVDENAPDHKLKSIGARFFGEEVRDAERAIEPFTKGEDDHGHLFVPPSLEAPYAAQDTRLTIAIREKLEPIIDAENLRGVLKLETNLLPVIADMEDRGVVVDLDYLKEQEVETRDKVATLAADFKAAADLPNLNMDSPDQLRKLLFETWGLPVHKTTPKGEPSVDKFALERLAHEGPEDYRPLIDTLREHARLQKMLEAFFVPLQTRLDADSVVHTRFTQMVRTGRMSSSHPNLQQIPSKDHQGKPDMRVRKAFLTRPGKVWLMVDYSQIELRILAWYSGSPRMLAAYRSGEDIHQQTADLLGIERKIAKNVNFAQVYGAGIAQLARTAGKTEQEARLLKARYRQFYPEVTQFSKRAEKAAEDRGYVFTVSGRRRRFVGTDPRDAKFYRAGNAIIQGSAADVMKMGMLQAWRAIQPLQREGRAHLVLSIHDELIFEVDEADVAEVHALVLAAMTSSYVPPIDVPIVAEARLAPESWGEASDYPGELSETA